MKKLVQETAEQAASGLRSPESVRVTKMDPAIKALWLVALRSGEYEQTRNVLRDDSGYCCLGVLCDISGLTINSYGDGLVGGERDNYEPIYKLVGGIGASHACSMRNDGLGPSGIRIAGTEQSFSQIADYIEQNL